MSRDEGAQTRPLEIHWSDRAKDDLAAIGEYTAAYDPVAAMRWVDRLIVDVERAAEMPLAGRLVPEFADRGDISCGTRLVCAVRLAPWLAAYWRSDLSPFGDRGMLEFCLEGPDCADSNPPQQTTACQTCLVASTTFGCQTVVY